MTKKVSIVIEKLASDNSLQTRITVVGIQIVKEHYSEADIQQLLDTISQELKPVLTECLNAK